MPSIEEARDKIVEAAMLWWKARNYAPSDFYSDPVVADLISACEELRDLEWRYSQLRRQLLDQVAEAMNLPPDLILEWRSEGSTQGEQLDRDTRAGGVEQQ